MRGSGHPSSNKRIDADSRILFHTGDGVDISRRERGLTDALHRRKCKILCHGRRRDHPRGGVGQEVSPRQESGTGALHRPARRAGREGESLVAASEQRWTQRQGAGCRGFLGVAGCVVRGTAWGGRGHHRAQRGGQEHAAQGALTHHRADGRQDYPQGPRGQPPGSGHGLSPGTDRKGERFSQRRDPGHAPPRDQREVRRDRRLCGGGEVPRHAGQTLQLGHVRAPGLRGGRAPRP